MYNFKIYEFENWTDLKVGTAGSIEGTINPAVNFEVVLCLKTIFRLNYATIVPSDCIDYSLKK